jgi:serine/threonine-protein kinase
VLDFGLAKALGPAEAGRHVQPDLTNSPTITSPAMTQLGMILGTAAYMSPEQARGKAADKRADIWAFGCVLYEMLTGKRGFQGEDLSETLAFVLTKEPDWTALPAATPAPVRALLRRCVERDVRKRVADASTLLFVLDEGLVGPASAFAATTADKEAGHHVRERPGPALRERPLWRRAAPAAAAALGAALLAGAGVWWAMRPTPPRVVRTEIVTTGEQTLSIQGGDRDVAITPDGARIIYRGDSQLLVRALDQIEPVVLREVSQPRGIFVSPDGQWIGFSDSTSFLKRVAITGGPAVTIAQMDGVSRGATWLPDDTVIFSQPDAQPFDLGAVALEGERRAELILRTPYNEFNGGLSADGRWLAYQSNESGRDEVYVRPFPNLDAGRWQISTGGGTHPLWARNGRELFYFVAPGTVMAVPVQSEPSFSASTPQVVFKGTYGSALSARHYDVSPDGRRFLMLKSAQTTGDASAFRSLIVVQHWDQELTRLVPTN